MKEEEKSQFFVAEDMKILIEKIDSLDRKVDEKFEGMDHKFDGINQKFEGIDRKFEGMDHKFEGMDRKFDGIDQKFEGMDSKFDGIDRKVDDLGLQLFATAENLKDLSVKVDKIDQKGDDRFDFTMNVLDKHTEMLTRLDQERIFTSEHLRNNDDRLDNVEADVSVLKLQLKLT